MADVTMTELEVKTEDLSKTPEKDNRVMSPDTPGSVLRRSTRASAIRAAEKLKGADSGKMEISPNSATVSDELRDELHLAEALAHDAKVNLSKDEPEVKKRKLADSVPLDPTDPHFAIQENDDGEVVVLSDDSEVSSLNDEEIGFIRQNYEKIACGELTDEQRVERERMIRQLKAELRCEEAKLLMLKKLKLSQQTPQRDPVHLHNHTNARTPGGHMPPLQRGAAPTATTGHPQAYRPPFANPQAVNRHPTAVPGQRQPPPLTQIRGNVPNRGGLPSNGVRPGGIPAAHSAGRTTGLSAAGFNSRSHPVPHANTPPMSKPLSTSSPMDTQTAAQKQAAAKLALRKQLEKTLLQIPAPKPPPPEMHFTPNPNQPDFVYMVGLDYCVQRLEQLKENKNRKAAAAAEAAAASAAGENGEKTAPEPKPKRSSPVPNEENPGEPYVCAQCGIDFTPFWKAVGDENKPKIMCESCVRSNQKKALKAEHTNRLKQAFVKALQQEQEIDQQIKAGTFNLASITTPSLSGSTATSSPKTSLGSSGVGGSSAGRAAAHQSSTSASAAASLQANLANMAAAGFPHQMFGFNPLMAAAARFPGNFPGGNALFPNMSMSKDFLKNFNRAAEQQRQMLMDMLPRPKYPHK